MTSTESTPNGSAGLYLLAEKDVGSDLVHVASTDYPHNKTPDRNPLGSACCHRSDFDSFSGEA